MTHRRLFQGLAPLLPALALLILPALAAPLPADVTPDRWSAPYIDAALNDASMAVGEGGLFAPERPVTRREADAAICALTGETPAEEGGDAITRGELAERLYRSVQREGQGFSGLWNYSLPYSDAAEVPDAQYEALCWLTMRGIFSGRADGRIDAGGGLTREQLAAVLYRFEEVFRSFPSRRIDYGRWSSWVYYESGVSGKDADVFFLCPTFYSGAPGAYQLTLSGPLPWLFFLGASNLEKDLYGGNARFFAPCFRQVGLSAYTLSEAEAQRYLGYAYLDVRDAFDYYMEHENNGRPIILAGSSQGADLCLRLLKDAFSDEALRRQLVACYAIGWIVTEADLARYPHLRMAQGADDTGVIISFNCEAESITESMLIPAGVKTLSINPLNWRTDSVRADRSLNLGACFPGYDGSITREIPALTGAYIDPVRGALKVPDVSPEEYPAEVELFPDGVYHVYDFQFFYRNLQKNVADRIAAFERSQQSPTENAPLGA